MSSNFTLSSTSIYQQPLSTHHPSSTTIALDDRQKIHLTTPHPLKQPFLYIHHHPTIITPSSHHLLHLAIDPEFNRHPTDHKLSTYQENSLIVIPIHTQSQSLLFQFECQVSSYSIRDLYLFIDNSISNSSHLIQQHNNNPQRTKSCLKHHPNLIAISQLLERQVHNAQSTIRRQTSLGHQSFSNPPINSRSISHLPSSVKFNLGFSITREPSTDGSAECPVGQKISLSFLSINPTSSHAHLIESLSFWYQPSTYHLSAVPSYCPTHSTDETLNSNLDTVCPSNLLPTVSTHVSSSSPILSTSILPPFQEKISSIPMPSSLSLATTPSPTQRSPSFFSPKSSSRPPFNQSLSPPPRGHAPSFRGLNLSSIYNQQKQRIHSLLHHQPSDQPFPSGQLSPSSVYQEPVTELARSSDHPQPMNPLPQSLDSITLFDKHFATSIQPNLPYSTFPSSSATEPIIPDAAFEDGPLTRAQLSGLEHRAAQLKKSIKPLIKVFQHHHASLCSVVESEDRLDQTLQILDQIASGCYRSLKEMYSKSDEIHTITIDQERKERLEVQVLRPLRKMWDKFKEMSPKRKSLVQRVKLYEEALQKYLAMRSEGQSELRKIEQLKARSQFARVEYHHWIYELAVFHEVEVLELLTEYMSAEHTLGLSRNAENDQIGQELKKLRRDLACRRVERESQKISMETYRQCLRTNLANLLEDVNLLSAVETAGSSSNDPVTSSRLSMALLRSSTHLHHTNSNYNAQNHYLDFGDKLRGFALTLTGKAFGTPEGSQTNASGERPRRKNTPPEETPNPSPNTGFPQFNHHAYQQQQPLDTVQTSSMDTQLKKEGFLLHCTKSLAAGATRRSHSPTDLSQGTGGTSADANRSWKKVWCVLADGELREYKGDGLIELNRSGIDLRYAMVRERKGKTERKFSFEVVTTQFVRVYQAFSHVEMKDWVAAIEASIESSLNQSRQNKPSQPKLKREHHSAGIAALPQRAHDFKRGGGERAKLAAVNTMRKDRHSSLPETQPTTLEVAEWKPGGAGGSQSAGPGFPSISVDGHCQATTRRLLWEEGYASIDDGNNPIATLEEGLKFLSIRRPASTQPPSDQNDSIDDHPLSWGEHEVGNLNENGQEEEGGEGEEEDNDYEKMISRNWRDLDSLSKESQCAECGASNPRWASYSLGILVCIHCSGLHRGLGTHISKVRSLDLDGLFPFVKK